jgi:2',3'-cyclic-nucleotide 2'-phosphodiesterase (5'-nucleotidase family)
VDVWYGGHSHNQIVGEVNGVPTMISGAHGEVIGVCDLVTDPVRHRVIEHRFRLETVYADELPPDSAMAARVERWNRDVGPLAGEVIGASAAPVTRSGGENLIGELVSDAMRTGPGIDIAMTNSGGLRADLPAGPITRGGVYEVMPFENTVVTMKLSGAEVRRVLEDGLRHGRVTQVSGIRYTFDNSAAPGSRVQALTLTDGGALADTRDYVVAVNNFMADGGDEYETLRNAREKTDTHVTVRDRIMDYVRQRCAGGAVLDVKGDGRITRAGR